MNRRMLSGTGRGDSRVALVLGICVLAGSADAQAPPDEVKPAPASFAGDYRDAIDASAPHDAKAANRLQLAETLIQRGQPERALEALLYTLDRADGAMVRLADGSLSPVGEEANRLIGSLPTDTLDLYRRQYGPASERALEDALASGQRERVEAVALQFRHTPAGRKALLYLAAVHFDRGEFGLALRGYEKIFAGLDPASRLRMACAAAFCGKVDRAQEIASTLADADLKAAGGQPASRNDIDRLLSRAANATPQTAVNDWRMPFGDATSSALAAAGEPILLRRWQQPLAFRMPLQSQIERLTLDLHDSHKATVPAMVPLAIGDRVIARTLHGTSVYSISQGRLLWESADQSLEQRLSLGLNSAYDPAMRQILRMRGQFGIDPLRSSSTNEFSPLANTLFRNGVYGHVTADDQRLYVVEDELGGDQTSAGRVVMNRVNILPPDGSFASAYNRLVAYDLETGRLAWPDFGGLGGDLTDGPFEPPLAGYFFFGPPTPGRNELYVVGEAEKQVRLVALDPDSGQERWTRAIAEAPVGIAQDPVRQLWPAQVAVGNGVLVCPTTVGWLVAIEQTSHSILWATRYAPPKPGGDATTAEPTVSPASLNTRWAPAAPMIHGNKVYFTPAEDQKLVCLDLATGELLWQRGKAKGLYLAGAVDDIVLTVGEEGVDALDAASGKVRWKASFPDRSVPSGRAVLTSDRMFLPLRGDTLLAIDLRQGAVVGETPLPDGDAALGNLLLHRGTLLSLSPTGLTAFEERSKFVAAIESRLEQDPHDAEALLRQAHLHYVDGAIDTAAATLDELSSRNVSPDLAGRVRSLRWEVLAAIVRADGDKSDERLKTLKSMAQTPDERFLVRRLDADRALAAGNYADAARAYLSLTAGEASRTIDEENGRRKVALDAWLSGRLQEVWTSSDGAAREAVDRLITGLLAASGSPAEQARQANICRFHPAAASLELSLASRDIADGSIAAGETRLLRLSRSDSREAGTAIRALAKAASDQGLKDDADFWLQQVEQRSPAAQGDLASAQDASRDPSEPADDPWGDFKLTVLRTNGFSSTEPPMSLRFMSAELPFYRNRSMKVIPDRLAISGPNGVGLDRLIPLQVGSRSGSQTVAVAEGHLLFLLYRGMLQAVSPLENRVLWSIPVPVESYSRNIAERPVNPMRSANSLVSTAGSVFRSRINGAIAAANASYVAVEGRREISVYDATTGGLRWSRSGWPQNVTVVGTDSLLYVIPSDGRPARVLRAIDGQEIELHPAAANIQHAVAVRGDRLLLVEQEPTLTLPLGLRVGGGAAVSLFDPISGSTIWKRTYPSETLFEVSADGRLVVLTQDGALAKLDTATGNPSQLGDLPPEVLRRQSSVVFLEDSRGAYVVVNVGRIDSSFAGLATLAVNGEVFAFDDADGGLRWRKEVSQRRLICEEFGQMPALLFVDNEQSERRNQNVWRVNLLALDKRTGEAVLDESQFMNSTPVFRGFSLEPERRSIRLTGFNIHLRLLAVEKDPAPSPPMEKTGSD